MSALPATVSNLDFAVVVEAFPYLGAHVMSPTLRMICRCRRAICGD